MQNAERRIAKGDWRSIAIDDALCLGSYVNYRCTECGGRVRARKVGKNDEAAHFEHQSPDPGVRLSPNTLTAPNGVTGAHSNDCQTIGDD
jgi:hypothetical protein